LAVFTVSFRPRSIGVGNDSQPSFLQKSVETVPTRERPETEVTEQGLRVFVPKDIPFCYNGGLKSLRKKSF